MAERNASPPEQQRSSSQTSTSSRRSQKSKTVRSKPVKRLSSCSSNNNAPTDLTSFPSLTPDASPQGFRGEPALNNALSQALIAEERGEQDKSNNRQGQKGTDNNKNGRDRQATLEGLTSSLPEMAGRSALFDDSLQTREVPGSLHLASDEHIERMIARTGAVKLVRQLARDLALRDAEISSLRTRADERERELKRMLRDVQVSNQDIEHRLYSVENPTVDSMQEGAAAIESNAGIDFPRARSTSIDSKVNQAMTDGVGTQVFGVGETTKGDQQATVRPHRNDGDARSGSSLESTKKKSFTSVRGWQDYIWGGSSTVSRKTSGTSSVMSENVEQPEPDFTPRAQGATGTATIRRKALNDQVFLPPDPDETDGHTQSAPNGGSDNVSIASHKSAKSGTSWTVRLFAGSSTKDKTENTRSTTPDPKPRSSSQSTSNAASGTALAALKRLNGNTGVQSLSARSSSASSMKGSARTNLPPVPRRAAGSSTPQNSNNLDATRAARSDSANHGPVEMDAILPMESRPPTLTHIYENCTPGELLTDRFGFIYDQRRNRRQREANVPEIVGDARQVNAETVTDTPESRPQTSDGAVNTDETENRPSALSRWQDYLKIATKPTELLSHTPAAGPIVAVEPGDEAKSRVSSVSIDKHGTLSVANSTSQPSASTSNVVANHAEFANNSGEQLAADITPTPQDQEPVRLLLQRLTDLHDASQRDRTVKWNEFMRKVRAERQKEGEAAATSSTERSMASLTMPEASLTDGEVVGIAGLGNKGKVGRAKWREFKGLVLGGIPVEYRAKTWSECSGASALRVPGYYDELVKGRTADAAVADPAVVAQIDMDVRRTLTDNIFFRKGPGVMKLKEVLLAYSRRNPEVGYCQGMNLIAGSLLLIMPTAEDAFWVLASIIENILPAHYYDHGLLASRADQQVLRQYVAEILPKLSAHLDELGIELEALTFQWFLSVFTDCLSAEALYRVWDVVLCLSAPNVAATATPTVQKQTTAESGHTGNTILPSLASNFASAANANTSSQETEQLRNSSGGGGGGSTFFFQVALALLKLNENQLLNTCHTPASVYTYLNHQMTNHAISIDGLIQASEALRNMVKREDVVVRRAAALQEMTAGAAAHSNRSGPGSVNETECEA